MSAALKLHSVVRPARIKAQNVDRKLVIGKYRVAESVERVAQRYTDTENLAKSITDSSLFSEDFTAYADGVRVVNDLSKKQHLNMLQNLLETGAMVLSEAYYAVGPDNSVFVLLNGMSSEWPLSIICRFCVNQDGEISRLWSRRGVAAPEAAKLLKDPEAPAARLAALPRLRIKPAPPDQRRQANMLATMDSYIDAMTTWSDTERQAHLNSFTLEDFQKWEGTGVWGALSDAVRCTSYACEPGQWERGLVADRTAFSKAMGILNRAFGSENSPGRMRSIVRAKAASATHNLGFMHFDTIGLAEHGPIAYDVMVVFVFTQDGLQIKQAAAYRSSACLQEYASVFKMSADIAGEAPSE